MNLGLCIMNFDCRNVKKKRKEKESHSHAKKRPLLMLLKTLKSAVNIIQFCNQVKIYVWLKCHVFPVDLHARLQKKSVFDIAYDISIILISLLCPLQ